MMSRPWPLSIGLPVALILLACISQADAADPDTYPDEGAAFQACQSSGAIGAADQGRWASGVFQCNKGSLNYLCRYEARVHGPSYPYTWVTCGSKSPARSNHYWPAGQDCSKRAEETGWKGSGAAGTGSVCHNGCAYDGSVYAGSPTGRLFTANGQVCKNTDLPAPETPDPGDGDGGGSGEIPGDGGGGGDGGGDGSGPGNGGGDGGGGNGDGDGGEGGGDGDGDGDGDGNGEPGGEQPNIPSPEYEGDIPFPWLDGQVPSSSEGQWNSGLGNGSCPAPKSVPVGVGGYSTSIEFSFKPLCDFAILIRGLVLAVSAVVSAYIIAGVRR